MRAWGTKNIWGTNRAQFMRAASSLQILVPWYHRCLPHDLFPYDYAYHMLLTSTTISSRKKQQYKEKSHHTWSSTRLWSCLLGIFAYGLSSLCYHTTKYTFFFRRSRTGNCIPGRVISRRSVGGSVHFFHVCFWLGILDHILARCSSLLTRSASDVQVVRYFSF